MVGSADRLTSPLGGSGSLGVGRAFLLGGSGRELRTVPEAEHSGDRGHEVVRGLSEPGAQPRRYPPHADGERHAPERVPQALRGQSANEDIQAEDESQHVDDPRERTPHNRRS